MVRGHRIRSLFFIAVGVVLQTFVIVSGATKMFTPQQIGWQSFPLKPDKTLEYKKVTGKDGLSYDLKLQVFLPEGWQAGDKRPAAVFFHGGGWRGGGPDHYYPQSRYVALRDGCHFGGIPDDQPLWHLAQGVRKGWQIRHALG